MKPNFVPAHLIKPIWPLVEPLLAPAIARDGLHNSDDILADLMLGQLQLWVAGAPISAALVTAMTRGSKGRRLQLWFCGGEGDWPSYIETIAEAGGVPMRIEGRSGWSRVLPGFRQVGVILEREV